MGTLVKVPNGLICHNAAGDGPAKEMQAEPQRSNGAAAARACIVRFDVPDTDSGDYLVGH